MHPWIWSHNQKITTQSIFPPTNRLSNNYLALIEEYLKRDQQKLVNQAISPTSSSLDNQGMQQELAVSSHQEDNKHYKFSYYKITKNGLRKRSERYKYVKKLIKQHN